MPYPFQIVQGGASSDMLITYEFASASRIVRMNTTAESPVDTWMGWSRGRWEGDTLVVDVTAFNGESWFDRAGNYQTSSLHVVERYTPVSRDVLQYEATIEDPQLYTRPWKISDAPLSPARKERATRRIQVRRVRRRVDVWAPRQRQAGRTRQVERNAEDTAPAAMPSRGHRFLSEARHQRKNAAGVGPRRQ